MNGIKVLSLFDGISCGMIALERAGIKVDKYIAFEIEHNAIEISKKNYPGIVREGDVTKADFSKYKGGRPGYRWQSLPKSELCG